MKKFASFLFGLLVCKMLCAAAPQYTVQELSVQASEQSQALKINNNGQIFGIVQIKEKAFFTYSEQNGLTIFPFPLKGDLFLLNNVGQSIIRLETTGLAGKLFNKKSYAYYFWDAAEDVYRQIKAPEQWNEKFVVTCLNDLGQYVIVGINKKRPEGSRSSAYWDGILYQTADKDYLETVVAINNLGHLFGYNSRKLGPNYLKRPCIFNPAERSVQEYVSWIKIFQKAYDSEKPFNVFFTDNGIFCGYEKYDTLSCTHIKLPSAKNCAERIWNFTACAVNQNAQVIGKLNGTTPAIWEKGSVYALNEICLFTEDSQCERIEAAHDINDMGQIAATGLTKKGKKQAVLLNPLQ